MVVVAQLVRASVCGTEGRGFEPHLPPKTLSVSRREGSYTLPQHLATELNLVVDMPVKVLHEYKPAVLKDRLGDLRKQWYVEFYAYHAEKGKLVRKMNELTGRYSWPGIKKIQQYAKITEIAKQQFELKTNSVGNYYFEYGAGSDVQLIELNEVKNEYQNLTKLANKGDVILFTMQFRKLNFIDAVVLLANMYSIEINKEALLSESDRRYSTGSDWVKEINTHLEIGYHFKKSKDNKPKVIAPSIRDTTFQVAFEKAMNAKLRTVSKGSQPNYRSIAGMFIEYMSDYGNTKMPIQELESHHILGFLDWCQEHYDISNKTRNNRLSILSSMIGHLKNLSYLPKGMPNPCSGITYEKTIKRKNYGFTDRDRDNIFQYLWKNDKQLYLATIMIYFLFIRINELRALTVERFDWYDKKVFIRPENKTYRPRYPKISSALEQELDKFDFKNWNPKHYVFGKQNMPGINQVHKDSLSSRFKDCLIKLGIDANSHNLYSMKHTGVKATFRAGATPSAIKSQTGHKSIAEVMIYLEEDLGIEFDNNLNDVQPTINFDKIQ
jgi:integrase